MAAEIDEIREIVSLLMCSDIPPAIQEQALNRLHELKDGEAAVIIVSVLRRRSRP